MENPFDNLQLYVIRNSDGQFYRAKGYGGYGQTWVDDVSKAKVYTKLGTARAQVSFFANSYPQYPAPDLLRLNIAGFEVMDETKRVQKVVAKKKRDLAEQEERRKRWELEDAKRRYEQAQADMVKWGNKRV